MIVPVAIEISVDWVSVGNVLVVRWGIVPLPFPKRQILAIAFKIVRERILRWPH